VAHNGYHSSQRAGSDANAGSLVKPWKTLAAAQTAARAAGKGGSSAVTVFIRAGTYFLDKTWEFGAADTGATWAAYQACASYFLQQNPGLYFFGA
jgi:hypothetical protein